MDKLFINIIFFFNIEFYFLSVKIVNKLEVQNYGLNYRRFEMSNRFKLR